MNGPLPTTPSSRLGSGVNEELVDDRPRKGKSSRAITLPLFVRGDIDGFFSVFSNNLATALSGAAMLRGMLGDDIVFRRMLPGLGAAMVFGCFYYSLQALLTAAKRGRADMTAQPFGINTPGMFAWNAGIIVLVYNREGTGPQAAETAWGVATMANFISGIVNVSLAAVGPYINKAVPSVALLGSLASVGLAYLFTQTLQEQASWSLVTFAPFYLLMMALYADVSVPKVPSTLLPVLLASVMAWATAKATSNEVRKASELVGWSPPQFSLDVFQYADDAWQYIGLILPVTLTVSVGSIQCRQMAANAGDEYNVRWTMAGDGIATILASLMGCPWGMTVFIGHPAMKAMGAKVGYLWLTALGFAIVTWCGLGTTILALVPSPCLNSILLFVGLAVCNDALAVTSKRHYPAFMVSLVPCLCEWCSHQCQSFAAAICDSSKANATAHSPCAVDPFSADAFGLTPPLQGLYALGQGYLLTSIYLCSMFVLIIDRKFLPAAGWACVAAGSASCGLIHSKTVFLPWQGPEGERGGLYLHFVGAYLFCAVVFFACAAMQAADVLPRGPVDKAALSDDSSTNSSDMESSSE